MGKILLVRHGQDADNEAGVLNGRRDMSLTGLGRTQAQTVAEKLKDDGVEIILTSPLRRAYETEKIIGDTLGIADVITEELLIERDLGVLTGKLVADIPKLADKILPTEKVNYFLEAEGAEDFPSLYERAKKFLAKVAEVYPDQTVLSVTHGDIGKMIRAAYHNWSWEEGLKTSYFDNTGVLHLEQKDVLE